jgi:hypothetical protein
MTRSTLQTDCLSSARRGVTLLEVIVGAAMLVALLSVSAQALFQVGRYQKRTDQRLAAMDALQNAMEELCSKPWGQIDDGAIASLKAPPEIAERWPDMKIDGKVAAVNEPVEGKRIKLSISTSSPQTGRVPSLTTWVFRKTGS